MPEKIAPVKMSNRKNILGQIGIMLEGEEDYFLNRFKDDGAKGINFKPPLLEKLVGQINKARTIVRVLENIALVRRYDVHSLPVKNLEEKPLDFSKIMEEDWSKITEADREKDRNYDLRCSLVSGKTYNSTGNFYVDDKCNRRITRQEYASRLTEELNKALILGGGERYRAICELAEEFNRTPYVDTNISIPKQREIPREMTQREWEKYKKTHLNPEKENRN
jgi:hypothetical protein